MTKNKLTVTKRTSMLDNNNIRASVMLEWDNKTNQGCKFLPNDSATVKPQMKIRNFGSKSKAAYRGKTGTIIAASCTDGANMISSRKVTRGHTNYYVAFNDGSVHGFESYQLAA